MEPNIELISFSKAIEALKLGVKVARQGWNGKNMYVELQNPTELSKMTRPYLFMKTADEQLVPWLASQTDLLAEDWFLIA